jgi:hypothetical protein
MTSKEAYHATDFFLGFEQPRSVPVSNLVAALATLDVPYDISHGRKVRVDRVGRQGGSSQQRAQAPNSWGIQILGAEERIRAFTPRRALSPE